MSEASLLLRYVFFSPCSFRCSFVSQFIKLYEEWGKGGIGKINVGIEFIAKWLYRNYHSRKHSMYVLSVG